MSEDNNENPDAERDSGARKEKTEETNDDSSNQSNDGLSDGVLIALGFVVLLVFVGGLYAVSSTNTGTTVQPAEEFAYDEFEGLEQSGITNNTAVVNGHAETLSSSSYKISVETSSDAQSGSITYTYDDEGQTGFTVQDVENGQRGEIYENFNTSQRFVAQSLESDNPSYNRTYILATSPYSADSQVFNLLSAVNTEATGVVNGQNREDVVIYEIQGAEENFSDNFSIEGEIRFSENGYLTLADVTIETLGPDGNVTETTEQMIRVEDVGETTNNEPEWLTEAREQTEEAQPPEPPENATIQPEDGSDGNTDNADENTTDTNTTDTNTTDE